MKTQSIWIDPNNESNYPFLDSNIEADVAIIGGGICGVTAAKTLAENGYKVVILESHKIAESNTGRSTGNLYCVVDIPMEDLTSKYSFDEIQNIIQSRKEAVSMIEKNITELEIECSFHRVPWIRFSGSPEADEKIKKEFNLLKEHLPDITWLDEESDLLLPVEGRQGFMLKNQAQFNPYAYVHSLARLIQGPNCDIYEESHVEHVSKVDDFFFLSTHEGSVRAKYVIEATHTPLGISPLHTVLGPYREFGVAGTVHKDLHHPGIYWGYYEKDKVTSIRTFEKENTRYMMVIGEPHKVGQGDNEGSILNLINRGKKLSLFEEIDFVWGGQHYRPADLLPYIGEGLEKNSFVATGFSTDGLTYGTLAARIISNVIMEQPEPYAHLYRSKRFTPIKSAKKFVQENLNNMKQYVVDYLQKEEVPHLSINEGAIVTFEGHKYALSKNEEGEVNICSAVCTHMACIVHWNSAEGSWDCPCHGSRFQANGEVIEGPALKALESFQDILPNIGTISGEGYEENSTTL